MIKRNKSNVRTFFFIMSAVKANSNNKTAEWKRKGLEQKKLLMNNSESTIVIMDGYRKEKKKVKSIKVDK